MPDTITTVPTYSGSVTVIHDGNAFEWIHRDHDAQITRQSHAGYGSAGGAMLAGLMATEGGELVWAARDLVKAYDQAGEPSPAGGPISRAWADLRNSLHNLDNAAR